MAQRIEKQVIREMVCSKVSWHLDRGSPFCKMSDGSGRIRGMCGDGSEGVPYPGSGWKSLIDEEGVSSRILCHLLPEFGVAVSKFI